MKEKTHATLEQEFAQAELFYQGSNGKALSFVFDEPDLTSDAGLVPVAQLARQMGLLKDLAGCLREDRLNPAHGAEDLIGQRVFQIISGNPDANDSDRLRLDAGLQAAVGRECPLASQPTMTRLDNRVGIKELIRMAYVIGESFLESFTEAPRMIVIDMDPTAHLVYGRQQLGLFNTYVGDTCLMPFHVYDGLTGRLITTVIREGKTPAAAEILKLLKRIVARIRARFPETVLLFRADSHHTKPEVMEWMSAHRVEWVTGLAPNKRLGKLFDDVIAQAREDYEEARREDTGAGELRRFACDHYAAGSWKSPRRVVCRIIAGPLGVDARYVVTSYGDNTPARFLYEKVYRDRANAELFIKDHKLGLESDRSPCRSATANQFRLFLHSCAYVILHRFRERVLAGTALAKASFQTIRLKLLKVAARVRRFKTRIRFHLPVHFAFKHIFARVALQSTAPCRPSP